MIEIDLIEVIKESKEYAKQYIKDLSFHNLAHTENVVSATQEIGKAEGLSEKELQLLEIAAWFHDTGYEEGNCTDHENKGAKLCEAFLKGKMPDDDIIQIKECIMATQLPQTPRNLMEQVMCDSDLAHLGKDNFFKYSEDLRNEIISSMKMPKKLTKLQWHLMNIRFLSEHRYFTNYAREVLNPKKQEYLNSIQEEVERLIDEKDQSSKKKKKKEKEKLKEKEKVNTTEKEVITKDGIPIFQKPRRDVEAMFTTLARNQIGLSAIADRKASILLSINSMITSFAIGYLFRKIEELPALLWPSFILAVTGLVSVILAVLATRPNVKKHLKKDKKDLNLLFFGDFVDLELGEYQHLLREATRVPEQVYEKMSQDSYYLGKVLEIKYRRVRAAFNFFMGGITISVISFIIAFSVY
ncbi:Pycsar system effector family protein [Flammeovirga agarivorans]|uniref:Pycsar effector protein domain-containing protein n=1 Tax=Flammeovirga agarivorans TaxID=2726742 RepID=A0A7X8SK53_9BACT|nr:Pycsar system effector family protein [Flammeovirga agarivorans]NLR91613.1 hypothetical protein [Flammeovirga agarivorans]